MNRALLLNTAREHAKIRRTNLIVAVNACMFVFGLVLLLMGALLPSLHINGARAGSLGSFPLAGILAATILIGPILDKMSAKPPLATALVLISAALAVMPWVSSYPALAMTALVYGIGGGILNTGTNALISDLSASGRGVALNLLGCSFSLGAIAAPLLMSFAGPRLPIPTILHLLAVAPMVVLVFILGLRFPLATHSGVPLSRLLKVLSHPLVWLIGVLLFFESGNENCVFVWAGKLTGELSHVASSRADLALVGLSVAIGVGRLLAALGIKTLGNRNLLLLSTAMTVTGVIVIILDQSFGSMVAGFSIIGLGMSAIFPTALGIAGDHFPDQTGTVFGAIMAAALVGGTAGPAVGGWVANAGPIRVLAVPIAAAIAIAILTVVISPRKSVR